MMTLSYGRFLDLVDKLGIIVIGAS